MVVHDVKVNSLMHNLITKNIACTGSCAGMAFGINKEDKILYDLNYEDEVSCESDIPVIFKLPSEEILHISLEVNSSVDLIIEGINNTQEKCKEIVEKMYE